MDHENESKVQQGFYFFFPVVTFINNYELLAPTFPVDNGFIALL